LFSAFLFFTIISNIYAGDVANFKDLGFSPDGSIYMFGEYGVTGATLQPWARLNIVDVKQNEFVPGGRLSYKHDTKVIAGTDGEGALYAIIGQNPEITNRYGMNYLKQGHPLFITLLENDNSALETITFRDFDKGDNYKVDLHSSLPVYNSQSGSSFYLNVEKTSARGAKTNYLVGSPEVKRAGVTAYSIKKVTIKPETSSIVFIIELRLSSKDGSDVRYMVETLKL
jgi:predicted secreted protein